MYMHFNSFSLHVYLSKLFLKLLLDELQLNVLVTTFELLPIYLLNELIKLILNISNSKTVYIFVSVITRTLPGGLQQNCEQTDNYILKPFHVISY